MNGSTPRNRSTRRIPTLLVAGALALGLSGLLVPPALADGHRGSRHGHRVHERQHAGRVVVRVVDRPTPSWRVRGSWTWASMPAPDGCEASDCIVVGEEPVFRHTTFGVWLSGADFHLRLTNAPAPGYAYQDPYDGTWISDVRAYSAWCARHDRRPVIRVVSLEDRCSR